MTAIAIVTGSTRPGRKALAIAKWVHGLAGLREDASFDVVDIADFQLPHLDEPIPPIMASYEQAHTHAWSTTIASYDGYVFVTPEYNHSTSGALKNAIDFLFAEWNDKACGFVSYGVQGGTRAVEHLRLVAGELKLADVRSQVGLSRFTDIIDGAVEVDALTRDRLSTMLGEVVAWSDALRHLRAVAAVA